MRRLFLGILFLTLSVDLNVSSAQAGSRDESHRILEITDHGVFPKELDISSKDLTVFLLNGSTESLVSFEIDYGKVEMHCTSDNIKNLPDGTARSITPLAPRDFVATCFHEPGAYKVKFFGVGGSAAPVTATVVLK